MEKIRNERTGEIGTRIVDLENMQTFYTNEKGEPMDIENLDILIHLT